MKPLLIIVLVFFCPTLHGQIRFGTYQQVDTSLEADLKLYPNGKFDFYDTRNGSCWVWTHYTGRWELKKDTIIFTWQSLRTEDSDTLISTTDLKNDNIEIEFVYDDGKPVANVKTRFHCLWDDSSKTYFSDFTGKVKIPGNKTKSPDKRMCPAYERMLYFEIENSVIELSSNRSMDYYALPLSNIFRIIIKKNPKSYAETETKKYLIKNDQLVDIDKRHKDNYTWGNFKFSTTKYGR